MTVPTQKQGWRHGTTYGYDMGCRCDLCRAAKMRKRREARARARIEGRPAYFRELAASRELKDRYRGACVDCGGPTSWGGGASPPGPSSRCRSCHLAHVAAQHGTRSKYVGGCRCDACRQAATNAHREWRKRRALESRP